MMLKEEEARLKECRVGGPDVWEQTNDYRRSASFPNCIGARCMQWRWVPEQTVVHILDGTPKNYKTREEKIKAKTVGFCGLAGEPR